MDMETIKMVRQIKANARRMSKEILAKSPEEQKTEIDKLILKIANWD